LYFSHNGIATPNFFEVSEQTNHNFPLHCHYSFEFVLALSGNILIEKERETYSLKRGDAIAIMPLEKHNCHTPQSSKIIYFQISPKLISNWDMFFGSKTPKNPTCKFSEKETEELLREMRESDGSVIGINYLFFKVMNMFMKNNKLVSHYMQDDICLDALLYISKNFADNINLKDVASALGVSYVYLSRIFAKKINFRFVDCINSFRIQKALSLLANPDKSIGEICFECGFGSIRQFNRVFLDTMSCTPKEYKKAMNNI